MRLNWISVLLIVAVLGFFAYNLSKTNGTTDVEPKSMEQNIDKVMSFQIAQVAAIESAVNTLDEESLSGEDTESLRARYQKRFKNTVVVGDSLTEGLSVYGWLSSEQVFSEIGASVVWADDLFDSAAATYPKTAFFAFGMNDMGNYGDDIEAFTDRYKELIEKFRKDTPNTAVFICSISTPTEEAMEWNHSISRYKEYNAAIEKMSGELGLKYIDASDILPSHPELYAGDGIHADIDYYPYWMDRVLREARTPAKKPAAQTKPSDQKASGSQSSGNQNSENQSADSKN
ncbi:MAG: hypothetical protein IJH77_00890 [Mogibacterium sp.]|nr:hypothetical protein [Mogibacterium sp.]